MPVAGYNVVPDVNDLEPTIGYGDNGKRAKLEWRGNYPSPELTSASETSLRCERDRSDMPPLPVGVDELGPLDDHPF